MLENMHRIDESFLKNIYMIGNKHEDLVEKNIYFAIVKMKEFVILLGQFLGFVLNYDIDRASRILQLQHNLEIMIDI